MSRLWPRLVATVAIACTITACGPAPRGPRGGMSAAQAPPSSEAQALERHLATLEAQIAKLEKDLGKGRGAYRDGSLLRIEGRQASGGNGEPPLERLRRLERELADAESRIASRDARVAELTRELQTARDQGRNLGEQASDLAYARDALITAQQALAEARERVDGLRGQLTTSELQRLKAEHQHFRFAASVLKLVPGQTSQLLELQDEAREAARQLDGQAQTPAKAAEPVEHH